MLKPPDFTQTYIFTYLGMHFLKYPIPLIFFPLWVYKGKQSHLIRVKWHHMFELSMGHFRIIIIQRYILEVFFLSEVFQIPSLIAFTDLIHFWTPLRVRGRVRGVRITLRTWTSLAFILLFRTWTLTYIPLWLQLYFLVKIVIKLWLLFCILVGFICYYTIWIAMFIPWMHYLITLVLMMLVYIN